MSDRQKKVLIAGVGIFIILLGIGLAIGLSKRGVMLERTMTKVQKKLKTDYLVDLHIGSYGFDGLTTVFLDEVTVIPAGRDTLADIHRLVVGIRLLPLLWGEVKVGNLEVTAGKVSFVKADSTSNYDFLFRKKEKDSTVVEKPSEKNFATWTEKLAKEVFSKIPRNLNMKDVEVSYRDKNGVQKIRIPDAVMARGNFETSLFLNDHDAEWILKGHVDGDHQQLRLEVSSKEKGTELPFLKNKYGLSVSFDKLIFDLHHIKRRAKDLLSLEGEMAYHNLLINHRRLSAADIFIPQIKAEGGLDISSDYIALSEGSSVAVEDFRITPHIKFSRSPKKLLELAVHTGKFAAQDFFDAIPQGLFESLEGIEVKGDIAYDLDFSVDLDTPDHVLFRSSIDDEALQIVKWGKARVDSLKFPFVYPAYDDTTFVRDILVAPQNPNFVPLAEIPYVLKTTVRNTEDPFFYRHNGFEEEAFKLSIATNLKERKFKRGASTISMQLVKNVFLNRKKTMDRKIEEILLVWLMEASGEVSKDRLLEIYLNIIEWGKRVYGVSEAARYYFDKDARQLTLGESLFLSSIIPRPKTGVSSFDYTGHLKPWVQRHFNTYGYIMSKVGDLNNVAVPENYGFYEVVLQPRLRPARPAFVDTIDTVAPDIVEYHEQVIREMEADEQVKKSILDKLLHQKSDGQDSDR
ncbi:transglycosylase domain-containing protein [Sphingobacterium sp. SGG-5]|uniref:transglycosylase domain-containing protein n=1 Tax=Sphingobacterium sp. SGG-5 TaxID=2710881 RepID=UPI001F10D58B|nr:biosynthetic peptidoglycan transglycosylase [Sphingobacterium sp. SGG-5]